MLKSFLLALSVFGSVVGVAYAAAAVPKLVDDRYTMPAEAVIVEPVKITAPPVVATVKADIVGKPMQLKIPKINVNAFVEHLGLTAQGAVAAPEGTREVSWYNLGSRPGEAGNALISGHSGIWRNSNTAVFDRLPELKPGDTVYVADDQGVVRQFEVQELQVYDKDDSVPELFGTSGVPNLNIITCYGTWLPSLKTYDKRLVVFTKLKP